MTITKLILTNPNKAYNKLVTSKRIAKIVDDEYNERLSDYGSRVITMKDSREIMTQTLLHLFRKGVFDGITVNEKTTSDIIKGRKNKWIKFDGSEFDDELSKEVHDLVNIAYKPIGGHLKLRTPNDVYKQAKSKYQDWGAIDIDDDIYADVVNFGKRTKYGIKYTGSGHDGQRSSKKAMLNQIAHNLKQRGYYAEVSDKLADILINKYNVPIISDIETIVKLNKHDFNFVGNIPNSDAYGWYYRDIAGKYKAKILVGRPNV